MTLYEAIELAIGSSGDSQKLLYAQRDTDGDWTAEIVESQEEEPSLEWRMTRIGEVEDRGNVGAIVEMVAACWDPEWDSPAER